MSNESNVEEYFDEAGEGFTIYVCEQRFVVGQGVDYFRKFKGTDNMISTDSAIRRMLSRMMTWTQKKIPNIAELINKVFFSEKNSSSVNIIDIISALSQLFCVNEHQAAGPKVIDPIIIQEGTVSTRYLSQLIAMHKESILQPAIIILLKDNDFERAKSLLAKCPDGIRVKMIRNSGKCEIYKIINCGASDVNDFLDSYALQCFSTCSCTPRSVLLNEEWSNNSLLRYYSPLIFKIRSNLLFDEKTAAKDDISILINKLESSEDSSDDNSRKLLLSFKCMARLFRAYCNDNGEKDLPEALDIAKSLENPLLIAHTYRYANLFPNRSLSDREEMLLCAKDTFYQNNVEDHAVYCENNLLINQFYTTHIDLRRFREMQQEAMNNVPGLVGMSLILNNTGVAHLYSGRPDEAIEYFSKGLDYSRERIVQRLGLMTNIIIAKAYSLEPVDEREIRRTLNYIFDTLGTTRLPFLTANYVANILAVVLEQKPALAQQLVNDYPILQVIQNALTPNQLGSGSLSLQLQTLDAKFPVFGKLGFGNITIPNKRSKVSGIRSEFVISRSFNPTIFNAWL